jgi:hypothetical protein
MQAQRKAEQFSVAGAQGAEDRQWAGMLDRTSHHRQKTLRDGGKGQTNPGLLRVQFRDLWTEVSRAAAKWEDPHTPWQEEGFTC